LALRAVIFDYGKVLSGAPDPAARAALLALTGLSEERFESLYWADRPAYDQGQLTGLAFWQNLLRRAGLDPDSAHAEKLNQWDARMWSTQNLAMVAWQRQLKERGLLTAILSNMGDAVLAHILREYAWIERFDVRVWSYQLRIAKPAPAIYRYTLNELGTQPGETLFLDDKRVNVEAARALGIQAIEFSTVERLRADLVACGFDAVLPLP
jgi:putative hydrolase of the HAD superfamily